MGVDWNSSAAQVIRFQQILKICDFSQTSSVIDSGCGYGGVVSYLEALGCSLTYTGHDPLAEIITTTKSEHGAKANCPFTTSQETLQTATYVAASGIFNVNMDESQEAWTAHVYETLDQMNQLSEQNFSFKYITLYSDAERMRPNLHYADPCTLFHHCKSNYARNIALLHDYNLYDFTLLVRKESA